MQQRAENGFAGVSQTRGCSLHDGQTLERCDRGGCASVSDTRFSVGRLDKDSEGLLLVTNNGDIINQIMRAGNYHEKEYLVTVDKPVTEEFVEQMSRGGIPVLDARTRPCKVEKIGKYRFRIILTQGLNRQIRRMCEYCGCRVKKLVRVRVMNIELGNLPKGQYRDVTEAEMQELYRQLRAGNKKRERAGGEHGQKTRENERADRASDKSRESLLSGKP